MTTKESLAKHDREIASIRSLLKQGMRMLVDFQEENRKGRVELRTATRELQKAQKTTDAKLRSLIEHLAGKSNGKNGGHA